MFASIWYAKKLGRRFVHNARKAKSEKVWNEWGGRSLYGCAKCLLWALGLNIDAAFIRRL
jgi:hypothetical protein